MSDDERQACADQIAEAFTTGRLSRDEFDSRVEHAWAAVTAIDLTRLLGDLNNKTDDAVVPVATVPSQVISLTPVGVAKVAAFEVVLAWVAYIAAATYGTADWPLIAIFLWAFGSVAGAAGALLSRPKPPPAA